MLMVILFPQNGAAIFLTPACLLFARWFFLVSIYSMLVLEYDGSVVFIDGHVDRILTCVTALISLTTVVSQHMLFNNFFMLR